MSEKGGITKGKSHKEGGIPMVVKSTGQQVELEGGEGVINKRNMASDKKFEFQGKQMTTCEIASAINSANGNGVQIDCDDVTGKKYAYEDGGVVFINYKKDEIMYEPIDGKYYANDMEFDTLEEAQKFLDSGGVNENLRGAYERGLFEGGGNVNTWDKGDVTIVNGEYLKKAEVVPSYKDDRMVGNYFVVFKNPQGKIINTKDNFQNYSDALEYAKQNVNKIEYAEGGWLLVNSDTERTIREYATESEARQMMYEYDGDSFVIKKSELEKEKLRETYRPPAPLNPATYIGMERGGGVKDYKSLIGKYVNIYSMGVSLPTEHQIKGIEVSGENFRYRYVTLKFDLGIAPILLDEATAFMNNEIIYVNNNKEEFGIQLIPNQYKEGGEVPKANKMFHLPLELAVYVPSTQDVDKVISDSELDARVDEVSKYLATIFGGFTKSDKIGGFVSSQSELVTEEVVPVVSFATKEDYEANKNKLVTKLSEWARKWGQEAIGFEFEGDLYYVPQKFEGGGDVRDFSWYQDFKKQELKRGTEHEMEHVDSIKKFKKKGVSDKEIAEAIAKDHLEEDENYYIELDKMEGSRKLSEALNDFVKHKGYRQNYRKYNMGGSMMSDSTEIVHLKFTEDFNGVIRQRNGKYMSESMFPKGKVYKFSFMSNDGRNTSLAFGNTGAYMLVPNNIIDIVGFDEMKYGNGGSIMPYQSMSLTENDKVIMKLLTKYTTPSSFDSRERQKLATFRGSNVVNELSSSLIQKIYGLLFENHNVGNPIKELFLSNVGAGNIVSYAPKYIQKLMIDFDNKNAFVEVEKEINSILNEDKKYILFNNLDIKTSDAIIHVYPNVNPEVEQLNNLIHQSEKPAIGLGVCEFTSRERLNKFRKQISENQTMMSKNIVKYLMIGEGITDEGQYTLIYTITKY
jgi:hypothetical protein